MTFRYENIDHVQLAAPVGSEEEARSFYHRILGFIEVEKPYTLQKNGGAWLQAGNIELHIGMEEEFSPAKKAHPAISVKNIEMLTQHLQKNDIPFKVDENLPGAKRFYVNDPFGNRL